MTRGAATTGAPDQEGNGKGMAALSCDTSMPAGYNSGRTSALCRAAAIGPHIVRTTWATNSAGDGAKAAAALSTARRAGAFLGWKSN